MIVANSFEWQCTFATVCVCASGNNSFLVYPRATFWNGTLYKLAPEHTFLLHLHLLTGLCTYTYVRMCKVIWYWCMYCIYMYVRTCLFTLNTHTVTKICSTNYPSHPYPEPFSILLVWDFCFHFIVYSFISQIYKILHIKTA